MMERQGGTLPHMGQSTLSGASSRAFTTRRMEKRRAREYQIRAFVVFIFLVALGFPGNLEKKLGSSINMGMQYMAFLLQILAMLLSSGDDWLEIELISIERRYTCLYQFASVIFINSMLFTSDRGAQIVTCLRLTVTVLFAIWMQEKFTFTEFIGQFGMAQVMYVAATLLNVVLFPDIAFDYRNSAGTALQGLCHAKNWCAAQLTFGILVAVAIVRQRRANNQSARFWFGFAVLQGLMILWCEATGALLIMLALLACMAVLPRIRRLPIGWIYLGVSVLFLFSMLTFIDFFAPLFIALGKDPTISNRIPLWRQILKVVTQHRTFVGFGFSMFWRDPEACALVHSGFEGTVGLASMVTGAHNMLLEWWLDNGLLGLTSFFGMLLWAFRRIDRIPQEVYSFITLFFLFITANGMTERCLATTYDNLMVTLLWSVAYCANADAHAENKPPPRPLRRTWGEE